MGAVQPGTQETLVEKLWKYREQFDAGTALQMYGQAFPEYGEKIKKYRNQYGTEITFDMLAESLRPIGPQPPPKEPPAPVPGPGIVSRVKGVAKAIDSPFAKASAGLEKAAEFVDERTWGLIEKPLEKLGVKYIQPFTKKVRAGLAEQYVPPVESVKQILETGVVPDDIKTNATMLGLRAEDLDNPNLVLGKLVGRGVMPSGEQIGEDYIANLIASKPKDKQKAYASMLFRMFYDPYAGAVARGEERLEQRNITRLAAENRLTGGLAAAGESMYVVSPTQMVEHPEGLPKMMAALLAGRYVVMPLAGKGMAAVVAKSPLAKRMLTVDLGQAFKRWLKFRNKVVSPEAVSEFMLDLQQPDVSKGVNISGVKTDSPAALQFLKDLSNRYRGMSPEQANQFASEFIRPIKSRGIFKVLVPKHRVPYQAPPGTGIPETSGGIQPGTIPATDTRIPQYRPSETKMPVDAYAIGAERVAAMTGYTADDVIFMRAMGMTDEGIAKRAMAELVPPDVQELRQQKIGPGSSVVIPKWQTAGKVLDDSNSEAVVVQLDSGLKIKMGLEDMINADELDVPPRVVPVGQIPITEVPKDMRTVPDFLSEENLVLGRPLQEKVVALQTPPVGYYDPAGHRRVGQGPLPPAVIQEEGIPNLPGPTNLPPFRPIVPRFTKPAAPLLLPPPKAPQHLHDTLMRGEQVSPQDLFRYPSLAIQSRAIEALGGFDEMIPDPPMVDIVESDIRGMAALLASEANEGLRLAREALKDVLAHGGLTPYKKGAEAEGFAAIPKAYRRKTGKPPDEMADEMGITEEELFARIAQAEEVKKRLPAVSGKKIKQFRAKDFIREANDLIVRTMRQMDEARELGYDIPSESVEAAPTKSRAEFRADAAMEAKATVDKVRDMLRDETGAVHVPSEEVKALFKRMQTSLQSMYQLPGYRVGLEQLMVKLDGEWNKGGIISQWRAERLREMGVSKEAGELVTRLIDDPERFAAASEALPDNAKQLAKTLRREYAKFGAMAQEMGILKSLRENYINHIWKDDFKKVIKLLYGGERGLQTVPAFAKQRKLPTIQDGIELGLTPELDPIKLLQIYEFELYRTAAAKRFIDAVKELKEERGYPVIMGDPKDPAMKAVYDKEYEFVNMPGVNKLMAQGDVPAKVHPGIVPALETFFRRAWKPPPVHLRGWEVDLYGGYTKIRSFAKALRFFNPVWHGGNIWANNVTVGNLVPGSGVRIWNTGRKMWKEQDQMVLWAAESGVQVKHAASVASELRESMMAVPNEGTGIRHPLRSLKEVNNKALWEQIVRNSQLGAFKVITRRLQRKHPDWSRELVGKTAGHMVNDVYGTFPTYWLQRLSREVGTVIFLARNWCCDSTTRAMTKTGWKYHNELDIDEEILTFDPNTKKMQWGKLNDKFVNPQYDGDMVRIDNYNKSIMMTRDHTCYVYNFSKNQYEVVKAEDLQTNHLIPRVGSFDYPLEPIFDDGFVQLVAWMVTDGHFKKDRYAIKGGQERVSTRGIITQSKPSGVKGLKALGLTFRMEKPRKHPPINGRAVIERHPVYTFSVPKDTVRVMLDMGLDAGLNWDFLSKLTEPQLELLYQTMMLGDGTGQSRFCGKEKEVFFMTMVQLMQGKPSTFYRQDETTWRTRVIESDKISCWGHHDNKSIVPYSGTIWCPSVDTGFWVAERDGLIFITGNTFSNIDLPLKGLTVGTAGFGARFIPPEARKELAFQYGKFVLTMVLGGLVTINLLQLASIMGTNRLKKAGLLRGAPVPPHTTFQNGPKHFMDVDLGLRNAKGQPLYMVAGIFRNMRDWKGWATDPLKTFMNKMEPILKTSGEEMANYSIWRRSPIAPGGAPFGTRVRRRIQYFVESIGPSTYWSSRAGVPKTKTEYVMPWTGNFIKLGSPGGRFTEIYYDVKARYKFQLDEVDDKIDKLLLTGKWDDAFKLMDSIHRYSTPQGKIDRIMRFIAPLNYVLKSAPKRLKMAYIKEMASKGNGLKDLEEARIKELAALLNRHYILMYPEGNEDVKEGVQLEIEAIENLPEGTPGTRAKSYRVTD